jgi:hypothetical protein
MYMGVQVKYYSQILIKLEFSKKFSNIMFHESSSNRSRVVPWGQRKSLLECYDVSIGNHIQSLGLRDLENEALRSFETSVTILSLRSSNNSEELICQAHRFRSLKFCGFHSFKSRLQNYEKRLLASSCVSIRPSVFLSA